MTFPHPQPLSNGTHVILASIRNPLLRVSASTYLDPALCNWENPILYNVERPKTLALRVHAAKRNSTSHVPISNLCTLPWVRYWSGTMSLPVPSHPPLPSHRDGTHVDKPADELQGSKADVYSHCMGPWFCRQDSETKWKSSGFGKCEDTGKPSVWQGQVQGRGR